MQFRIQIFPNSQSSFYFFVDSKFSNAIHNWDEFLATSISRESGTEIFLFRDEIFP